MSYCYFETVAGHDLAELIKQTLPFAAQKQYAARMSSEHVPDYIEREIAHGANLVATVPIKGADQVLVVMSSSIFS